MLIPLGILSSSGGGAAGAYELISTTVLGSSASTVSFSSIVGTYKHLQIRYVARTNGATSNANLKINLNSDTGSNYAWHVLEGTGSAVASDNFSSMSFTAPAQLVGTSITDAWAAGVVDLLDYTGTKNKTLRGLSGWASSSTPRIMLRSGLWINTSTVTTIAMAPSSGSFITGSRFSLYGIKG